MAACSSGPQAQDGGGQTAAAGSALQGQVVMPSGRTLTVIVEDAGGGPDDVQRLFESTLLALPLIEEQAGFVYPREWVPSTSSPSEMASPSVSHLVGSVPVSVGLT